MDKNIDFNHLINDFREIREDDSFLKDSLNCSDHLDKTEDKFEYSFHPTSNENQMPFINTTTGSDPQEVNETNFSFQLLTDNLMDTKLTPTLVAKTDVNKRTNLFGFHNKKQLFVNNFCADTEDSKVVSKTTDKEVEENDNYLDNSLGLSPVKKCHLNDYNSVSLKSFTTHSNPENIRDNGFVSSEGTQVNSFLSNGKQLANDSLLNENDYSFKSVSKCSDLDFRAEDPKPDLNETFRPPNTDFQNKSISSYFKQNSEPISLMNRFDVSADFGDNQSLKNDFSVFDKSFASVSDEINSSNNTLEIVQKIIDRKNRKRKSDANQMSINSDQSHANEESFSPSLSSTLSSNEEMTDKSQSLNSKPSPPSIDSKSVVTSGVGTISTMGGQHTYSMLHSNCLNSIGFSADLLSPNQSLIVSPNVLCLTIGCFADFKLNYLKIRNISVTSFDVQIKVQANVDTLNSLEISVPNQTIKIPPLFDGILTDQITITPLKLGSFSVTLQLYASIENINLPLRPLSVFCQIKTEEISIKRLLNYSNCLQIDYNLFENSTQSQTIALRVFNRQIMNEIPLKLCLDSNKCIIFEPVYRHPESVNHVFRCSDPFTIHLATKTQYEMRIPVKIQAVTGVQSIETSLTVCTDSKRSHVLAIFRLTATFWPKKELMKPLLQCSDRSISLKPNKWKEIRFRNKSAENLIRVELKCMKNNSICDNYIKMSSNDLMITPLKTSSISLLADQKCVIESESIYSLVIKYDSGFGKSFSYSLSIQIVSN